MTKTTVNSRNNEFSKKENMFEFVFLVLWIFTTIFLGLYENYKLRSQGNEIMSWFDLNFPKSKLRVEYIEVDLSELNQK